MLSGSVSLLFEFLEGGIFLEVLDVVGQVRFFLFDLFFFDRARSRHRRSWSECSATITSLSSDSSAGFLIVVIVFRRFAAEHRCHVHLVQALLFAVPVAGNFVHLHRDRRR